MSESYKSKFNSASAPARPEPIAYHRGESHARNLALVMDSGERLFLAYAYLVSGTFAPDAGTVTLTFTTHTVNLRGRNLSALFDALAAHTPARITALKERYAGMDEDTGPLVTQINATPL